MLIAALEAEVAGYVAGAADERDEAGHRLVVRNGHAEGRHIATGAGPIEIRAPRVNDRRVDEDTGGRRRFSSSIIAPWCRKSPKVSEVLPLMYLHGMSSGDFAPALAEFFGSTAGAVGLGHHPPHRPVAGRGGPLRQTVVGRCRLRVLLGGWDSLQRAPRGGAALHPGHRGGEGRWDKRAGSAGRWPAGVHRVLGRSSAGRPPPGYARPGGHGGRRRPGHVGGSGRSVPRDPPRSVLGALCRAADYAELASVSGRLPCSAAL